MTYKLSSGRRYLNGELIDVNADLKLTHFCSERRFKSDTPPLRLHPAYAVGAVSRLAFTIPAAR